MSASLPVHVTAKRDIWDLIEYTFGLDRYGNAVARPHRKSWLSQSKKYLPKQEAHAHTHAWLLRLCWLRRMELWLIEAHQDSSYAFLDHAHIGHLGDLAALMDALPLEKEARNSEMQSRFPLLPALPLLTWFSEIQVFDLDIEKGLEAIRQLDVEAIECFGKQQDSPRAGLPTFIDIAAKEQANMLNPLVLDGALEVSYIKASINKIFPDHPYRIVSGPGGYKRELPADQELFELALQVCFEKSEQLFSLAPDPLAADRWQYHLGLACIDAMHVCPGDAFAVSELPEFHRKLRIGKGLRASLDTRLPIEALLPDQPVRLGIWRTALGRFHRAVSSHEHESARELLADLPRHFKAPLRPEGLAWRQLQKLLKLEQASHNLFDQNQPSDELRLTIEEARKAFRKSNLQAFEWRYAFPEVLNAETADFQGFDFIQLLLPEALLRQQEHLLLAWVQLAWKLLKPGATLVLWLPDDIQRWRKAQAAFHWMEKTGKIIQRQFCRGEYFEMEITGKQIVVWRKT
jgi:hypothetical protein